LIFYFKKNKLKVVLEKNNIGGTMKFTEPKIYLIGETVIKKDGFS